MRTVRYEELGDATVENPDRLGEVEGRNGTSEEETSAKGTGEGDE